jgi:hypothetical protein
MGQGCFAFYNDQKLQLETSSTVDQHSATYTGYRHITAQPNRSTHRPR